MKLHANAPLGPNGRERMVLRVIEQDWSLTAAAEAAGVSERTCSKWVARYRRHGAAGLLDRSSAPHRASEFLVSHSVAARLARAVPLGGVAVQRDGCQRLSAA
jgi:transposase